MSEGTRLAAANRTGQDRWLRDVLGGFATGVAVVTAVEPASGEPVGLVMNSFTSVSLRPPLIALCVAHTSTSWPRVRSASVLCVNILGEEQRQLSGRFAASGREKFRGVLWNCSPAGAPVLAGSLAWLECEVVSEYPAGDHMLVVARVREAGRTAGRRPLVFFGSQYVTVSDEVL